MNIFRFDWHTPTHLFGCFFLASLFQHVPGVNVFDAALIAISLGIAWELLDEIFKGKWIMDPRGYDLNDIAVDVIGAVLAIWI